MLWIHSGWLLPLHSTPDFWPGWVNHRAPLISFQRGATPAELSARWRPAYSCSKHRKFWRVVLHWRLRWNLTIPPSSSSHLRYTTKLATQHQATVKFHGVFASHWKSPACAPEWRVQGTLTRDSGDLVTPFMQSDIQSERYYAHVCYFNLNLMTLFIINWCPHLRLKDSILKIYTSFNLLEKRFTNQLLLAN